jgi:hypothetical protein
MKTFAILRGWANGPWHTGQFIDGLEALGFRQINDPSNADVIFAHSLGCFMFPKEYRAKLILITGLPYWPHKSILTSLMQNLRVEIRDGKTTSRKWSKRLPRQLMYIFRDFVYTIKAMSNRRKLLLPENSPDVHIVMVRNKDDVFCHPDIQEILPITKSYRYIELPNGHDDCWVNPKPYIDLLSKEL